MAQGRTGHYLSLGLEKSLRPLCVEKQGSQGGKEGPSGDNRGKAAWESLEPAPGDELSREEERS